MQLAKANNYNPYFSPPNQQSVAAGCSIRSLIHRFRLPDSRAIPLHHHLHIPLTILLWTGVFIISNCSKAARKKQPVENSQPTRTIWLPPLLHIAKQWQLDANETKPKLSSTFVSIRKARAENGNFRFWISSAQPSPSSSIEGKFLLLERYNSRISESYSWNWLEHYR